MKTGWCIKFTIINKDLLLDDLIKHTKLYVVLGGKKYNLYIPLLKLLQYKDVWVRGALFIKLMSEVNTLVPVPMTYSREYGLFSSMMVRLKNSPYIKVERVYTVIPEEDRRILEEYLFVKRRVLKPLLKSGELRKRRVIRGRYASYLLQAREDIIDAICLRFLTSLRIIERLLVPNNWTVKKLALEIYNSTERRYRRRVSYRLYVMKMYGLVKYSTRYGWVLTMTREEIMKCLFALHRKRCRIVDSILTRILYAYLREKGYTTYHSLKEIHTSLPLSCLSSSISIKDYVLGELVKYGYLSRDMVELAKYYGVLSL